jgi:xylulokinase
MILLGLDIGSSSIKVSYVDIQTGTVLGSAHSPENEMSMMAPKPGWAEQHPQTWWEHVVNASQMAAAKSGIDTKTVAAIGISYQMHGLVCIDKTGQVLRPSIIWCDSRAVETGQKALAELGEQKCLEHLLNSPGNFTASKLKWVKDNEPHIFDKIDKIMLPGDYIAYRLTDQVNTTTSGLSEGILWDFKENRAAGFLMDYYGFDQKLIPDVVPTFGIQGNVSQKAAGLLNLKAGIPVAYRAGDQPNNALSLNVLEPGEIAATAGTSGVVYGVSDQTKYDPLSRVNTFLHVNNTAQETRNGVLLCINGTGILNSWLRKNVAIGLSYNEMNNEAMACPPGSDGLLVYPFGNGAERMLQNKEPGSQVRKLNFNIHHRGHLIRAAHEGLAFAFYYGMQIMKGTGIELKVIRTGNANMFLSPVFRTTLASLANVDIELYNTDGSVGAALGAGLGAGIYKNAGDAFKNLKCIETIKPDADLAGLYAKIYKEWAEGIV